jgi:YHS domain-containing protein
MGIPLEWRFTQDGVGWQELSDLYRAAPLGDKKAEDLKLVFSNSLFKVFVYDAGKLTTAMAIFEDQAARCRTGWSLNRAGNRDCKTAAAGALALMKGVSPMNTVTDPVCGMTIDPAKAVGSSTYRGETYHFCSRGCETKFDVSPESYAGAAAASAAAASCCSTGQSCHC